MPGEHIRPPTQVLPVACLTASDVCKKTSLWSGCQAPCLSAVSFEKCHPAKPRLLHARLRFSARVMPLSLHHTLKMRRGTSCNRPSGSTIESTGTGCSTAAMTSERRADETQVVTGCARGPDKGSRLGLGTLGAAHSPDKTLPSRSGSGGRAPSRSGFFALYHPSEPSPAQPEQNLPRENPCLLLDFLQIETGTSFIGESSKSRV